jgi:hypothetical protein
VFLKRYERKEVRGWGSANDSRGKKLEERVWMGFARAVRKSTKGEQSGREYVPRIAAAGWDGIGARL